MSTNHKKEKKPQRNLPHFHTIDYVHLLWGKTRQIKPLDWIGLLHIPVRLISFHIQASVILQPVHSSGIFVQGLDAFLKDKY